MRQYSCFSNRMHPIQITLKSILVLRFAFLHILSGYNHVIFGFLIFETGDMSNPIFPHKLQEDFIQYKSLPSHRSDKIFGLGFSRREIINDHIQRDVNTKVAFVIVLVLEGNGVYTDDNGKSHPIGPGQGFQRIPGKQHQYKILKDQIYSEVWFHIPRSIYLELKQYGAANEISPVLEFNFKSPLLDKILKLAYKLELAPEQQYPSLLMEICTIAFDILQLSEESKVPSYHKTIVQEACKILNDTVRENIKLPSIAQEFNISYERFRKVFKEIMFVSPGSYRIRARIQYAQALLIKRDLNINEIANHMGYPDAFSFSKQFKKEIGVSPENFLKNLFG